MTFNLEYGAEAYGARRAAGIILRSGAQVALLQEINKRDKTEPYCIEEIVSLLGWYSVIFKASGTAILSTLPMQKIAEASHFGLVKIGEIYYCVLHLSDYPYIPFEAVGIKYPSDCTASLDRPCFFSSDPAVLQARSLEKRKPEFSEIVEALTALPVRAKIVAGGDFNEPSHRDWTASEVARGSVPLAVQFPSTRVMEHMGFIDSYRETHPNIAKNPGYTWPDRRVDYPHRRDRIDFIFAKNMTVLSSEVMKTRVSDHAVVKSIVI